MKFFEHQRGSITEGQKQKKGAPQLGHPSPDENFDYPNSDRTTWGAALA